MNPINNRLEPALMQSQRSTGFTGSIRTRILDFLKKHTGESFTCAAISKAIGKNNDVVSSQLKKMVDEGLIIRVRKFGSRGGNGYGIEDASNSIKEKV